MKIIYLTLTGFLYFAIASCQKHEPNENINGSFEIQISGGNNQSDTTGNTLRNPIVVRALKNGIPIDSYYLRYETATCYTPPENLYSNKSYTEFYWKLTSIPGKQLLKIILFDKNKIKRDSVYATANAIEPGPGWHSSACVLNATPTDLAYLPNGTILSGSLSSSRLLQSIDNGQSWLPFRSFNASGQIEKILPLSSKDIFLATVDEGILFSSDSGKTWITRTPPQSPTKTFGRLEISRSGITFASAAFNGVYYSADYGLTWQKASFNNVDANNFMYVNSQSNGSMYALCGIDLVVSNDNGKSWNKSNLISNGYKLSSVFIDEDDAIYLGVYNYLNHKIEIIVSKDNGATWQTTFTIPVATGGKVYIGQIKKQFGFYSFYVSKHGIIKTTDFKNFTFLSSENTQDGVHYVITPDNWVVTYSGKRAGLSYFKP